MLEQIVRRAVSTAAVVAIVLVAPVSASAVAPTSTVLSGLSGPYALARDADGNLYYTDEPVAATTRLSVLRQGQTAPASLFTTPEGGGIGDVGFDSAKNAYAIAQQVTGGGTAEQYEIRRIAANTGTVSTVLTTTAAPLSGPLTSGYTIEAIEPAGAGTLYFAARVFTPSGNELQIRTLFPGSDTPMTLASFPADASGAAPSITSFVLAPNGTLAFDVQANGLRTVYVLAPGSNTPKPITSQPSGRALGFDAQGNLYVFWRTYTNKTSTFCADSTTVGILRFTPAQLASANPAGTAYGKGTFAGANFIFVLDSTSSRVSGTGQVFFALDQADCRGPGQIYLKARRLLGVPAGGGAPVVLDEDDTDPAINDNGAIGIALGPTDVYRSSYRLGDIAKIGLQYLPPGINFAANASVDFDGDRITDLGALYRGLSPADSLWYAPGTFQIYFGATSDIPVPGDYNGDGRTDAVIFRPSTALWYGPATGLPQIVIQMFLGQSGDVPIPGDYDGDGTTDPAIYRPSTQIFFAVLSGGGTKTSKFGAAGDVPVPRDYDGDGKTDFAIYRADANPQHLGLWYAPLSGGGVYQIYFGAPGDIPVPGDYDGDKKAEAVIFREATGLWYGPKSGGGLFQLLLGGSGDVPIPGYYDDNLVMDPATYHKANGNWFALLSGGGVAQTQVGQPTDVPIQKRPALAGGL